MAGPPSVSIQMIVKLLKLKAKDAIASGAVEMRSNGNVMERNCREAPAPSMRDASMVSLGSAWSAPVHTKNQYG